MTDNEIPIYPDNGCKYEPSCLSCSLPECIYVQLNQSRTGRGGNVQRFLNRERYREMVSAYEQGMAPLEIATQYNVSRRTVYRAIEEAGVKRHFPQYQENRRGCHGK